jgi:predicted DCC family thiol-disulfide oxidoreductase YuxK
MTSRPDPAANPIVLYDGVCALCNRFVTFVLARDRAGTFRFASLQSDLARTTLMRHGRNAGEVTTLVLVLDAGLPTERLLDQSSAALQVLKQLPGGWRGLGRVMTLAPAPLRDVVYDLVARTRYRTFGKYDVCPLPSPAVRDRFLDK